MPASGSIRKIKAGAQSPEGLQAFKDVREWARRKAKDLERSERLGSRRDHHVTR